MAEECLHHWKGNTLIYVGEGAYGCTANDGFHDRCAAEFEIVKYVRIPQWESMHDVMEVHRRKSGPAA